MMSCLPCDAKGFDYVWTEGDQLPRVAFSYPAPDPASEGLSFVMILARPDGTVIEKPADVVTPGDRCALVEFYWTATDLIEGCGQKFRIRTDGTAGSQTSPTFSLDVAPKIEATP